jgi:threonyl-tRNA synthetase
MFSRRNTPSSPQKTKDSASKRMETPFEARRRELAEQEAALRAEQERHRRLIEQAPLIAEQRRKEERDFYLRNAQSTAQRLPEGSRRLPDDRYLYNEVHSPTAQHRRLDRQKGKWTFFFLLLLLLLTGLWMAQTLWHPSF